MNQKFYIITRKDLSNGDQIAQVAHSATTFARESYDSFVKWKDESSYIVVLSVENLKALQLLREKLLINQVEVFDFYEPDLDDKLTAISLNPEQYEISRRIVSNIPLAFQEKTNKLVSV